MDGPTGGSAVPRPLLAAVLIASLAACQEETPSPTATDTATAEDAFVSQAVPPPPEGAATSPPQPADAEDNECGADKVSGRWLNALPSEDVKASIRETVGERPIRYYTQGDPITMDFSPARLNVELGKDGRIKLFRCG